MRCQKQLGFEVVFVVVHGLEAGGDFLGGGVEPEVSVGGGCGARVAEDAAFSDVAGEPGKVGCAVFRLQDGVVFELGDVVDGVGGGIDQLRCSGKEECGFYFAGVEAILALLWVEAFVLCAGGAEDGEGAEVELGAEIAGHDVYEGGVAAVGVVECQLAEAGGSDAGAEVSDDGHEGGSRDGECAGESDVLVGFAIADGWECVDRHVSRKKIECTAEADVVDEGVCSERQVWAVLLDGCGRQDEERAVFRESFNLLPVEVGEVAVVGDPGFHAGSWCMG